MAAFSTTLTKIGINGFYKSAVGAQIGVSTASSVATFTCECLENVFIYCYNPSGAADITLTLTATTARYASSGRGTYTITTAMASSDRVYISGLESAWFQTSANTFTLTATTAIEIAAFELSSTRCT